MPLLEDDKIELIDLTKPPRREIVDRPSSWLNRPKHLSVVELRLAAIHLGCDDDASFAPSVRGLIVGENPGKRTHQDLPLFPWPERSAAGRLLTMSRLKPGEYLGGLWRRNLCDTKKWVRTEAEKRARLLVTALFDQSRDLRVVLCGVKVARAFGLSETFWTPQRLESRQECVVIPHPSGLNRIYNEKGARRSTRRWMRWAVLGARNPQEIEGRSNESNPTPNVP